MARILKFILGFFLTVLILFYALGMFKSTVEYGSVIEINKPLKETWAVFMDDAKMDQWLEGMQDMKLVEGKMNETGSKYTFKFNEDGNLVDMKQTLTKVVPNERFEMTLASEGMMSTDMVVTFEEKDANTTILNSHSVAQGEGMFMRSMFALMGMAGAFDKSDAEIYGKFKKLVEENTDNYFPEVEAVTEEVEAAM